MRPFLSGTTCRPRALPVLLIALLFCLPVLFFCLPVLAASPTAEGVKVVGGSFSFSSAGQTFFENQDGDRTQEWTVNPGGGYFVADGLALGFHLEGRWFTQGQVRNTTYAMGPTLEYYRDTAPQEDPKGRVLPHAGVGYLWGQTRQESPDSHTKHNSGMISLSAGLAWMLSSQVATDIAVNFQTGRFIQKVPVDGPDFKADRWTLRVGFKAFLP